MVEKRVLKKLTKTKGLKSIPVTVYQKRTETLHLDLSCPVGGNEAAVAYHTNLKEVLRESKRICARCGQETTNGAPSLTEIWQEIEKYKRSEKEFLKLLKNPTYENLKEAYLLSQGGIWDIQCEYWINVWAYETYDKIVRKLLKTIKKNREQLAKSLTLELGLGPDNGRKLLAVLIDWTPMLKNPYGEFEAYLIDQLYGHASWARFLVVPANFGPVLSTPQREEFEKFDERDIETMETLLQDGGVYADAIEAARAAVNL